MIKWIRKYNNFSLVVCGLLLTGSLFYLWQILGVAALVMPMVLAILIQLKIYVNQIKNKHYQLAAYNTLLKEQISLTSKQLSELNQQLVKQITAVQAEMVKRDEIQASNIKTLQHKIETQQKNLDQRLLKQIADVRTAVVKQIADVRTAVVKQIVDVRTAVVKQIVDVRTAVVKRDERQASKIRALRQALAMLAKGRVNEYRQIEALFYLNQKIKPRLSLPPTRGWSVAPDFINIMMAKMKEKKPQVIVELGSGASTLIASYILQTYHIPGKILSLDHLKEYADATQKNVISHELDHITTVIHAPLEAADFNGNQHLWYCLDAFKSIKTIDMLIVDGPPGKTQKLARYPALPALYDRLGKNAVILLDDTRRVDESEMLEVWDKEYKHLTIERFETEKGTAVIHVNNSDD